eukprot:CAMPEP_0180568794 /NCGR_PEP_ID=MMETSP1037_2-20121125/7345_1 /TAXON_ID=632150 /ORGANISM="Azadinium spinosum, Strain 3D9" /LENGTH=114 /DNA_ID=CAMNT_0022586007 /DNA_START=14 /DNA_END=358 /DNA_ORIENTATION=-
MAQVPEATVSTLLGLWTLLVLSKDDSWTTVLVRDKHRVFKDVGAEEFNALFQRSPHHIIRRTCITCKHSHRRIFYKRHLESVEGFEAYDYMKSNWSSWNNAHHVDFELYSSYEG